MHEPLKDYYQHRYHGTSDHFAINRHILGAYLCITSLSNMERLVLCVLLLTTCAGTVSSDKSQGKTVQQLGDDPPCGTPVECYAEAIEALKDAEQRIESLNNAILTLNQTLKQVVANQSQVNEQLKANQTSTVKAIGINTNEIAANKNTVASINKTITVNTKDIHTNYIKLSSLKVSPCNCGKITKYIICTYPKVTYLNTTITPNANNEICCDICLVTSKEAAAYALPPLQTNLLRPMRVTKSKTTGEP